MSKSNGTESRLNDLDGKEWVKSTKSWFVINPRRRTKGQINHPAKFPEELVKRFLKLFTRRGEWVLDPFVGVGSTLIACGESSRNGVGIELSREFVDIAKNYFELNPSDWHRVILCGDSRDASRLLEDSFGESMPRFNLVITSPPYYNMLQKSRGGNDTTHKERREKGLNQVYSDSSKDVGNLDSYDSYLDTVHEIMSNVRPLLADGAYLVVIAQNMRDVDGTMRPIAWDLAAKLSRTYKLQQEMIWCQDNKRLGCWGYPTTYVSNVHHHYCLVFKNE